MMMRIRRVDTKATYSVYQRDGAVVLKIVATDDAETWVLGLDDEQARDLAAQLLDATGSPK